MKKIFSLLAAAMFATGMYAASYGIMVNGKDYYPGEQNPDPMDPSFQEYMVLGVSVSNGSTLQLWDKDNNAGWAVDLDGASVSTIVRDGDHYNCTADGCYDFYIKLKYQADELYVGACSGGGGNPGGQGGGDTPGGQGGDPDEDVNYYAIGWINGADAGEAAYDQYDDKYLFVNGKLTIDCQMGSYIALKDHLGNFYYSKKQTTIADQSVKMEWANGWQGCEKWAIPEGVNYIIIRSAACRGTIMLERVDKATYDAYQYNDGQGVEQTKVSQKARKMMVNGQLVIVRGEKMFDATGREL